MGSGKSTVARMLGSFGAKIIDADKIAHRIIQPGTPVFKKLIRVFGKNILKKGKIDRNKLGKLVFNNKGWLRKLNKIMHPRIIKKIKNQIKSSSRKIIVLDAPLLIEAGLKGLVDKLIVVKSIRKKQIKRLLKKTAFTKKNIFKIINTQIPLKNKVRVADFVIDNSKAKKETRKQVRQIRRLLWKS